MTHAMSTDQGTDQSQQDGTQPDTTQDSTAPNPAPSSTPAAQPTPPTTDAPADPWAAYALDDDLKTFVGQRSPAEVAKELKNAQGLIGKKTIGIPGKDSTPEEQRAFHEARGVPKDEAGYDFGATIDELVANAPEGWQRDEKREAQFRTWARNSNLSNTEANNLLKQYFTSEFEGNRDAIKAASEATKTARNLMTERWGADAEGKTNAANRFARHVGLDDDAIEVFLSAAGTKPEARFKLIDYMANQGAMLEEGGGDGKAPMSPGGQQMTADQARVAKEQFLAQGDNQAAYMDSSHPRHGAVERQVTAYLKIERGIK
jgi:hypothetical protein